MIRFLDTPPCAFKFSLCTPSQTLKKNHMQVLSDHVLNTLVLLRLAKIIDTPCGDLLLRGDLFDKSMNAWASSFLSREHTYEDSLILSEEEVGHAEFTPFPLPIDSFNRQAFKAHVVWDQLVSRLVWLQIDVDSEQVKILIFLIN